MRRLAVMLALAAFGAPAFAQTADPELKAFIAKYVEAFNRGDAAALAKDFYAVPGASTAETQAKLARQIDALRANEFGKMTLYGVGTCVSGATAQVQVEFAYNFTYGGVMDPGDQAAIFEMAKTDGGWRITETRELKQGQSLACAV